LSARALAMLDRDRETSKSLFCCARSIVPQSPTKPPHCPTPADRLRPRALGSRRHLPHAGRYVGGRTHLTPTPCCHVRVCVCTSFPCAQRHTAHHSRVGLPSALVNPPRWTGTCLLQTSPTRHMELNRTGARTAIRTHRIQRNQMDARAMLRTTRMRRRRRHGPVPPVVEGPSAVG
jgi:hypothetical protein